MKKILICGAGSIGIYLGAKLFSKGNYVDLFGRRKLRQAGEKIFIDSKEFKISNRLFKMPKNGKYDFLFLTSKLYDYNKIIKLAKKSRIKAGVIASIQNGLVDSRGYEKKLGKKIVPICVYGGFRIDKNKVMSSPTKIGWLTENSEKGKEISKLVSSSGIKCRTARNFDALRVEKLIVNCCLNALSAIEKKQFNMLFKNKEIRERISRILDECYDILSREYKLDKRETIKKRLVKNWKNVKHYSSTYQDAMSGRKTEINFFNGYVAKLARKHGIDAKENKLILADFSKMKK